MEHTPQSFRDIFTASEHRSAATVCRHLLVCVCLTLSLPLLAQEEDIDPYASIDGITMQETSRAIQKKGVNWCAMPFISYNDQLGFYGRVAASVFDFRQGSGISDYDQMLYAEAGYSSRHAGLFRAYYDTRKLLEGYKLDFDLTYQPDALYDFYGFNGYQAYYDYLLATPFYPASYYIHENPSYISSTFYRMKRNYLRGAADIQGLIAKVDSIGADIHWHAGLGLQHFTTGRVDYESYNDGLAPINQLKDTTNLFDLYRLWGLISPEETSGGLHPYLHAGASISSQPSAGSIQRSRFYGDLFLTGTFAFGGLSSYNNLRLNFNWKHHVTLWPDVVTLAYMVGGQLTLAGKTPFYQNGIIHQFLCQRDMFEGIGADNLPRGMLRNRLLGRGYDYASVELRINVFHMRVGKKTVIFSLNPFVDQMMILQPQIKPAEVLADKPEVLDKYFRMDESLYMPHVTVGCGAKATVGGAFVVSCDWAAPLREQDNENLANLYFTVGYLF